MLIHKVTKSKFQCHGGLYFIDELLKQHGVDRFIDKAMPDRAAQSKYSDSQIMLGLAYSIYSGGQYLNDVDYVREQVLDNARLSIPSKDTIEHRTKQLAIEDQLHLSPSGVDHVFNLNTDLNRVLFGLGNYLNSCWSTKPQVLDYDHTIIYNQKADSRMTYKKARGYQPGVGFIGKTPIYYEARGGNSNAHYLLTHSISNILETASALKVNITRFRSDGAAYQKELFDYLNREKIKYYISAKDPATRVGQICQDDSDWETIMVNGKQLQVHECRFYSMNKKPHRQRLVIYGTPRKSLKAGEQSDILGEYQYAGVITNDMRWSAQKVISFHNKRGAEEKNFDILKYDFNWQHMPHKTMSANTVYHIFTAMACTIYNWLIKKIGKVFKTLTPHSRIKHFMLYFVFVVCKWTTTARRQVLNIYSHQPYQKIIPSG